MVINVLSASLSFNLVCVILPCTGCAFYTPKYINFYIFFCWVEQPSRSYSDPGQRPFHTLDPFFALEMSGGKRETNTSLIKPQKDEWSNKWDRPSMLAFCLTRSKIRALQTHTEISFYFPFSDHSPSAHITKSEPCALIFCGQSPFLLRISDTASCKVTLSIPTLWLCSSSESGKRVIEIAHGSIKYKFLNLTVARVVTNFFSSWDLVVLLQLLYCGIKNQCQSSDRHTALINI